MSRSPGECSDMDYSIHIGDLIYISLKSPYQLVHIRERFLRQNGSIGHSSTNGVGLKQGQLQRFLELSKSIETCFPEINRATPCKYTHQSLDQAVHCSTCFPMLEKIQPSIPDNFIL